MDALMAAMESDEAAAAMEHDGVVPEKPGHPHRVVTGRVFLLAALCLTGLATAASATPGTTPGTKEHVRGKVKRHWDRQLHTGTDKFLLGYRIVRCGKARVRGPLARPPLQRRQVLRRIQGHRCLLRAEGARPLLPAARGGVRHRALRPRRPRGAFAPEVP